MSAAERRYREIASGVLPENVETVIFDVMQISIVELLVKIGFAHSNSDARRLITGGGIKIDGETIADLFIVITWGEYVLSRGKNRFMRVKISNE